MEPKTDAVIVRDDKHAVTVQTFTDTNGNGIPDYKEPWFWLTVGRIVSRIVVTLAPAYTIAAKLATAYLTAAK